MVLGLMMAVVFTFKQDRNSQGYRWKMAFFFLYEMTMFIIYIGVYMRGLYLEAKTEFKRKVVTPTGTRAPQAPAAQAPGAPASGEVAQPELPEEGEALESVVVHWTRVALMIIGGFF